MKEAYRIPRPPELAGNGNPFDSGGSEELLSVLGFSISEAPVVQDTCDEVTQALDAIETSYLTIDDRAEVCETDPFLMTLEQFNLRVEAI
jgi:hypothetical protein